VILPIEGMIDVVAEKSRLQKEIESHRTEIGRIENLLMDNAFLAKAPPQIVDRERSKLSDRKGRLARLEERLTELG
jgi:valyl-tRNA synthetase